MIITREVNINITYNNYDYYTDLGYDIISGETITVPIELLPKSSHVKITCQCDGKGCDIIKEVNFKNYVRYNNIWGFYYCRKCAEEKRKKSLQENYKCDYPLQNKKILEKKKKNQSLKWKIDKL
jgi:hypothetical protein